MGTRCLKSPRANIFEPSTRCSSGRVMLRVIKSPNVPAINKVITTVAGTTIKIQCCTWRILATASLCSVFTSRSTLSTKAEVENSSGRNLLASRNCKAFQSSDSANSIMDAVCDRSVDWMTASVGRFVGSEAGVGVHGQQSVFGISHVLRERLDSSIESLPSCVRSLWRSQATQARRETSTGLNEHVRPSPTPRHIH